MLLFFILHGWVFSGQPFYILEISLYSIDSLHVQSARPAHNGQVDGVLLSLPPSPPLRNPIYVTHLGSLPPLFLLLYMFSKNQLLS